MAMWKREIFAVTALLVAGAAVSVDRIGPLRKISYDEITRKLRATAEMANVYSVGPSVPKTNSPETNTAVVAENICPSVQEWKNISNALTADGTEVTVIQGMFGWAYQWFYTVRCSLKAENKTCQWIDEKQAPKTACRTGYNLVPAIVLIDEFENGQLQSTFDWHMIRIPGRCACYRIRPMPLPTLPHYATRLSALK